MKIRKLLIIILILFSSLPLILSHSIAFIQDEEAIKENIIGKLNAIANIQHKRIRQFILDKKQTLNLISRGTQIQRTLSQLLANSSAEKEGKIKQIISRMQNAVNGIEDITIYSVQKKIMYSSSLSGSPRNLQLLTEDYKYKLDELNLKILKKEYNKLAVELVSALYQNSKIIGYISIEFSDGELLDILSDYTGLGNTGEILLAGRDVNGNTQFLTPTKHDSNLPFSIAIDKDNQNIPITHAMNGISAVLENYNDYRNIPVLAISRHIPEVDWGMIVKIDQKEVFAQLNNTKELIFQLIIFIVIAIVIIAIFIGKKLAEPICKLEEIADRVEKGERTLKAPESNLIEINKLGNAFNSMVTALLKSEENSINSVNDLTNTNLELAKYKGIIESSNDLFAYVDNNYQFKMANNAYLSAHGLTYDEVINHDLASILGKSYFEDIVKSSIDKALGGDIVKFRESFDYKTIGKRQLNITYTPYKDKDQSIIGFIFKGEDITQLEEQQKLIELHVTEQEQIIASMLEGIITTNSEGNIILFNPEATNIFGYPEEEVQGKNVSILISEEKGTHSEKIFTYLDSSGTSLIGSRLGKDVIAIHKDKHTFPLRISVAELNSVQDGQANYIINCQDLTDIEQQKDMLNRSLKMEALGNVSGGIAHDFNNILSVIVGYTGLLRKKQLTDEELRYFETISRACERGARLTKNLLTFCKGQSSEARSYCINDIISANETMLQTMLTSKVTLILNLSDKLLSTLIDRSLFEDMVLNMSINASQSMENSGTLIISTENEILTQKEADLLNLSKGGYIKLTIEDNGCGMDKETMLKIFDPFFTTKDEIGNGLGLFQCYGFIKLCNGAIDVQSVESEGTVFSIYFPETPSDYAVDNNKQISTETSKILVASGITVLVVDDEDDIRSLNEETLRQKGFTVFSCGCASDALKVINNEEVDFVVSDVIMPGIGGVEFINQAKKIKPDLKYLFVSGYIDSQDTDKINAISPILYKPYTEEELLDNIQSALLSK